MNTQTLQQTLAIVLLLLSMSALIWFSGKGSWTALCVCLASFYFDHWLMSRHDLRLSLSVFLLLLIKDWLYCRRSPHFHSSKTWFLRPSVNVCVCVLLQLASIIRQWCNCLMTVYRQGHPYDPGNLSLLHWWKSQETWESSSPLSAQEHTQRHTHAHATPQTAYKQT